MKTFDFTNPERWTFEKAVYLYVGSDDTIDYSDELMREMADMNGVDGREIDFLNWGESRREVENAGITDSRYLQRGTCDHCGAHVHYGALYRSDENEVAVVGNICASRKLNMTAHEYADAKLRSLVKRARTKLVADRKIAALLPNRREALDHDHYIVRDIRSKFRKYHSISVKQWALVKKIKREDAEREARFAEERAKCKPIPAAVLDGRTRITGEIVSTKWQDNAFGGAYKMLVKDDRGFKVWGTVPRSIDDDVYEGRRDEKTLRVEFDAKIEASRDDETFGFFSRPTKAAVTAA